MAVDFKLQQAIEAYGLGRYELAVERARKAIALRPAMPDSHSYLALSLRQLERSPEAIEVLRAAIAGGVDREAIRRQLGQALAETGNATEAIRVLEPLRATGEPESRIIHTDGPAVPQNANVVPDEEGCLGTLRKVPCQGQRIACAADENWYALRYTSMNGSDEPVPCESCIEDSCRRRWRHCAG